MNNFNQVLLAALGQTSLLPVFRFADAFTWQQTIDVCYACGIRTLEYTEGLTHRKISFYKELFHHTRQYPDLHLGFNTINAKQAAHFCGEGAAFIASSFLHDDMASLSQTYAIPWIPGCNSEEDIISAKQQGASIISLLPGSFMPADVGSLKIKFPDLHFIPSSGIMMNNHSIGEWLKAGALCIRMSKKLFPYEDVAVKDWEKLKRNMNAVLNQIKMLKDEAQVAAYSAFH
ncbi:MAG TPA: hypothetical protein VD884_04960 [Ohtaekwangia sp.]|nr:hypothetical protein [Ohtaekwangia sp.]